MKKFFKNWFNSPKYVLYVDVKDVAPDDTMKYMQDFAKKLNIKRALYIPTRTSETRLERL